MKRNDSYPRKLAKYPSYVSKVWSEKLRKNT